MTEINMFYNFKAYAFYFNKFFPVVFPLVIYIWGKTILSLWPGTASLLNHFGEETRIHIKHNQTI